MKKKVLFVFNPVSGRAQIRTELVDILGILDEWDCETIIYPTNGRGAAKRRVMDRASDLSYIICCGGDGTLDEVVAGMMDSSQKPQIPIGYIPAGSTNDFATSLGISGDMKEATRMIVEGETFSCDIGRFNDKDYFVYVAAFGIFTEVSYQTPQTAKNTLGHLAYILQGARTLGTSLKTYHIRAVCEDFVVEDDFAFGMVTNSISVGGFPNITGKYVDLSDGLFEVTLIKMPKNPVELNNIITALNNRSLDCKEIVSFKTNHLTVSSDEEIAWTKDGEYGGDHMNVELTNCQHALRIRVPKSST